MGKSVASSESDISNRKHSSINEDNEDDDNDDDANDGGSKEGDNDGGNKQGDDSKCNNIDNVDFEHLFEDDTSIERNDYAAQEYNFMDRMWHWLLAPVATINDKNQRTIKSTLLIQAGIIVEESATTDENCLHELMYMTYQSLLCIIPFD